MKPSFFSVAAAALAGIVSGNDGSTAWPPHAASKNEKCLAAQRRLLLRVKQASFGCRCIVRVAISTS
jgi:hypothetical protein